MESSLNHKRALEEFRLRSIGKRLAIEKHQATKRLLAGILTTTKGQAEMGAVSGNNRAASMELRSHRQCLRTMI